MSNLPQTLTTRQVMDALQVKDPDTVYALVKSGRLKAVRLGREYRFTRQALGEFLGGGPVETTPVPRRRPIQSRTIPAAPRILRRPWEEQGHIPTAENPAK